MGAIVSRWRAKPTTVEVLEGIDKDILALEEYREKNQRRLKLWVGRLLLYSALLYLISCVVVYVWYLPEQMMGRLILALPFIVFPILVWLLRKLMIALFSKRTERNNEKLEDLKSQKRKILEQVMETETYKNAKLILERFDPDSKKKIELEGTPLGPPMTPRPGQELRQRHVTPRPAPMVVASPGPGLARLPPIAPAPAKPSDPASHTAPGGPPERNLPAMAAQHGFIRRPMAPGTPVPGMGMHPPGPPLARPVLPRERRALDRVIEYFVGDGPQNRYALICQQCLSHNGMALKEEFEYIAFRCAYCYFLNPARKTRPQAPRLPEPSAEKRISADPAANAPAAPLAQPDPPPPTSTEEGESVGAAEGEAPESEEQQEQEQEEQQEQQEQEQEEQQEQPAVEEPSTEEPSPEEPSTDTPHSQEPKESPSDKSDEEQDVSAMEVE